MKTISLTQGQVALVDDGDYEELAKFKWYADRRRHTFYAARNLRKSEGRGRRIIHMHHQLLDEPLVDHEDRNGLNNQRHNLRAATLGQNVVNSEKREGAKTSIYKGVYWNKNQSKWMTRVAGKYLGYFEDEKEAARAYDKEALGQYGPYAQLNFPGEPCT